MHQNGYPDKYFTDVFGDEIQDILEKLGVMTKLSLLWLWIFVVVNHKKIIFRHG